MGAPKGRIPWNKGLTKELDQRISRYADKNRGRLRSSEIKAQIALNCIGRIPWNRGLTKETDERVANHALKVTGKSHSAETRILLSRIHKGRRPSVETRLKMRQSWKFNKAMLLNGQKRPNKAELHLSQILEKLLPGQYKYTGDGQFVIANKCPDFVNINGQKKIIELFGIHWHDASEVQTRTSSFTEFGFNTLIVWDTELDDPAIADKIIRFNEVK